MLGRKFEIIYEYIYRQKLTLNYNNFVFLLSELGITNTPQNTDIDNINNSNIKSPKIIVSMTIDKELNLSSSSLSPSLVLFCDNNPIQ